MNDFLFSQQYNWDIFPTLNLTNFANFWGKKSPIFFIITKLKKKIKLKKPLGSIMLVFFSLKIIIF